MKSFFIEKEMPFEHGISVSELQHILGSKGDSICSFTGPVTITKDSPSSIFESHDVQTYIEKEPMFNFLVMRTGLTLLETRLFHRLLVTEIAHYLGKGFFRHYTQVFYNDFHLSLSNVTIEGDTCLIYVGLFMSDHLDFNIMGLENFHVDVKEMGLTVMQKYIHECNQLDV